MLYCVTSFRCVNSEAGAHLSLIGAENNCNSLHLLTWLVYIRETSCPCVFLETRTQQKHCLNIADILRTDWVYIVKTLDAILKTSQILDLNISNSISCEIKLLIF